MLLELLQGLALLLALCFLYGVLLRLCQQRPRLLMLASGLLFGGICAIGMWAPAHVAPGVFVDARSVVLSMAALVCGPGVALLAASLAAVLRWWLGGSGVVIGLLVIAASSGLGLLYRWLQPRWRLGTGPLALLLFGLLLHLAVAGLLQWEAPETVARFNQLLAWPFVLVFGLATAFLGWLLQDLQQRQRTEADLTASQRRLHTLLHDLPAISVQGYRADGTTIYWNKASEHLYGYSAAEALGRNLLELIVPAPMHAGVRQAIEDMFRTGVPIPAGELRLQHKDGHAVDVFSSHAYLPLPGQEAEMFCLDIDLSARKAAEEQARFLALYDPLTQLPNRRLLADRLQQALAASVRSGLGGALLCLDIDHFKTLNDSQGHAAGDQLLALLAQRLQACVREQDTVARIGGDEFVVLLAALATTPLESAAQTRVLGERILQALRQPCQIDGQEQHPSASMGATLFGPQSGDAQALLQQADLAMYRAKEAGRNQLHFFDPVMQAAAHQRQQLITELHKALREQELRLYYQPQVDADGQITGAEVLLRWQHPERGMIAPGLFIPLAEETGQILALGEWVLQQALAQQARWRQQPRLALLHLSVNVSARQFRHTDFVADLHELLQRSGTQARCITLELTESLLLQDVDEVSTLMQALRSLGLQLSLDDFGTGYSSLGYLKRLHLTQVKIDQGFVRGMLHDHKDVAIARSIITLAQELGLTVVAEGVETEAHHQLLQAHGCRHFQGYLFGRPMPLAEFEALVQAHNGTPTASTGRQ